MQEPDRPVAHPRPVQAHKIRSGLDPAHQDQRWIEAEADAFKAWEQACRQRWRALALAIKAKLEAVEAGITTFEDEFMAHIVLPDGSTFGAWARPQIAEVYATGSMPSLLALEAGS